MPPRYLFLEYFNLSVNSSFHSYDVLIKFCSKIKTIRFPNTYRFDMRLNQCITCVYKPVCVKSLLRESTESCFKLGNPRCECQTSSIGAILEVRHNNR